MLGIAGTWVDAIQLLRVKELDFSKKSRTLMMWMNVLGKMAFSRRDLCDDSFEQGTLLQKSHLLPPLG